MPEAGLGGLDAVDLKVLADIDKYGWAAIGVFPTVDDPGAHFTYSVGFSTELGPNHPEMIVTGLTNQAAHSCLQSAYMAITAGVRFTPNTFSPDILKDLPVAILEVLDPVGNECPMTMGWHLFGEERGLQIVWPDAQGKFPWDEGFNEKFRARQPLLGVWNGP